MLPNNLQPTWRSTMKLNITMKVWNIKENYCYCCNCILYCWLKTGAGQSTVRFWEGARYFPPPKCPDRIWDPTSILSNGHQFTFSRKYSGRKVKLTTHPSNADFRNECGYIIIIIIIIIIVVIIIIIIIVISFMQVFIHIFQRQTMSLGNTAFQLFSHYYLWCLYR